MILFNVGNRPVRLLAILLMVFLFTAAKRMDDTSQESSKPELTVALLQLKSYGADLDKNLQIGEKYCRKAKSMGADIILFPEMWSIGYSRYHWPGTRFNPESYPLGFEEWRSRALGLESDFIRYFRDLARELEMGIVITYLQEWDPLPRNSATVIAPDGSMLMTYAKAHTSDMIATESNCTPGKEFFVCDYPIEDGTVKLGIMTCFDREFPESARILMLNGAEIVLTPNACKLDDRRINQFQSRAFENAMGVAMANYAAPSQNGRSCAFDAEGYEILVAGGREDVYLAGFDLKKLRKHRKRTIWGNAYRRPQKYSKLLSLEVDSVFIRENGLGDTFIRTER